jgi:hypothetical protein
LDCALGSPAPKAAALNAKLVNRCDIFDPHHPGGKNSSHDINPLPLGSSKSQLASLILEQLLRTNRKNRVEQWLKDSNQIKSIKTCGKIKVTFPNV